MAKTADRKERGNRTIQRWIDLHTLFYEMNLIEQIEWLNESKRTPLKRIRNWILHFIVVFLFVSSIILVITPNQHPHHFLVSLMGGYTIALNYYAILWIIRKASHRHDP